MRMKRWCLVLAASLLAGCGSGEGGGMAEQQTIDWQALAQKRVVFAHQSVGKNMLAGVELLSREGGASLPVEELRGAPRQGGITHFRAGRNRDPLSKLQDFSAAMDAGAAGAADVALVKLCYVDIVEETDAKQLARSYIDTLDGLAQRHPGTTFVAVTSPLTRVQTGLKGWVKQVIGRTPAGYEANARRAEFNEALRAHYAGSGRLFDLARLESAGGASSIRVDGREVEVMAPELTNDGGHLNERGQRQIAAAFLAFLSALPKP